MKLLPVGVVLGLRWLAPGPAAAAEPFAWQTAPPHSQRRSGPERDTVRDGLTASGAQAFLVVRNDRIVYEWYAPARPAAKTHYTASLAKALVGGVSLAVAVTDGRIGLDDPVARFVPRWKDDP